MDFLINHLVDSLSCDFGHGNFTTVEVGSDFVTLETYRAGSVTKILNNSLNDVHIGRFYLYILNIRLRE